MTLPFLPLPLASIPAADLAANLTEWKHLAVHVGIGVAFAHGLERGGEISCGNALARGSGNVGQP